MLDPRAIASIDEMRFLTGSESYVYNHGLRMYYSLEKYYGIKRDLRYISVFGKEEAAEERSR